MQLFQEFSIKQGVIFTGTGLILGFVWAFVRVLIGAGSETCTYRTFWERERQKRLRNNRKEGQPGKWQIHSVKNIVA